jgi:hypothetical protein
VTDQVTVTEVVTDTLVIISETIIVPVTYPQSRNDPYPAQGPVQQPTQDPVQQSTQGPDQQPTQSPDQQQTTTSWITAAPGWQPSQGPDQQPTQSPDQQQTTTSWITAAPGWQPSQGLPPDQAPPVPTQSTILDSPPPVPTETTILDSPPPVPTQSTVLDTSPPVQETQPAGQAPPVETLTTIPPEWGSAPYNPFDTAAHPPPTQAPPTASPQITPAPTGAPENPPGPTPVPTTSIVPLAEFTPGPDAPTDVDLPPLFDPGLGPTGGPVVVIPADMQSPARCGPNQPNCADAYYCDPQPLCAIGQNCPGLCLPKLASIYSQPDNMRSAVWDKAMKDGIYRLAIVVTEIRTAIPIVTNAKWLTMASNRTGEGVASASPFKNATASVAMAMTILTAESKQSASVVFTNVTASVVGSASLLTAELSKAASPSALNATALQMSSSRVFIKSTQATQAMVSSVVNVEVKPSSTVVEPKPVSLDVPVSSAVFAGKWLNSTSNSSWFNSTAPL